MPAKPIRTSPTVFCSSGRRGFQIDIEFALWGDSFDEAMHRFSDVVTVMRKQSSDAKRWLDACLQWNKCSSRTAEAASRQMQIPIPPAVALPAAWAVDATGDSFGSSQRQNFKHTISHKYGLTRINFSARLKQNGYFDACLYNGLCGCDRLRCSGTLCGTGLATDGGPGIQLLHERPALSR